MPRKATVVLLLISIGAAVSLRALSFWSGYHVDVAPLGLLTPLAYLCLYILPAVIALVAVGILAVGIKNWRQRMAFPISAFVVLALHLQFPRSYTIDAFETRMKEFSKAQYVQLSKGVWTMYDNHFLSPLLERLDDDFGAAYVEALKHTNPILEVSPWTPKVMRSARSVSVVWGSGLTGALRVEIWYQETPSDTFEAEQLPSRKLYRNVYAGWYP